MSAAIRSTPFMPGGLCRGGKVGGTPPGKFWIMFGGGVSNSLGVGATWVVGLGRA